MDPMVMSLPDQIALMKNTTIFISPPGPTSFLAGFLNHPSIGMILDGWDHKSNTSTAIDGQWWEQLGAFHYLPYKYGLDEAVFPAVYYEPLEMSQKLRAELELPIEGPFNFTEDAKQSLLRNYANVNLKLEKYKETFCELLHLSETNYGFVKTDC
jgi:hypothetical protein